MAEEIQKPAIVQNQPNSMAKHMLAEMKRHAYSDLWELAEIKEDELVGTDDECEAAEYMLEKIMKDGTYRDAVHGMHHFIDYVYANDALKSI